MADKKPDGLDVFKSNNKQKVSDTGKKLKVGIIGTGWIARAHTIELISISMKFNLFK